MSCLLRQIGVWQFKWVQRCVTLVVPKQLVFQKLDRIKSEDDCFMFQYAVDVQTWQRKRQKHRLLILITMRPKRLKYLIILWSSLNVDVAPSLWYAKLSFGQTEVAKVHTFFAQVEVQICVCDVNWWIHRKIVFNVGMATCNDAQYK